MASKYCLNEEILFHKIAIYEKFANTSFLKNFTGLTTSVMGEIGIIWRSLKELLYLGLNKSKIM